jgi:hypothetical protein
VNQDALLLAEAEFLHRYPEGFDSPELIKVGKKHKMEKMTELTHEAFASTSFVNMDDIIENWIKTVSRSSMVSLFEKPRFKEGMNSLPPDAKKKITDGLYNQLHGDEEQGFNAILDVLTTLKLAKWSLITIVPAYYSPNDAVFVKPTTAKGVVAKYDLNLVYKPRPSWEFYQGYRQAILQMKELVHKSFSPSNAAFSGFLMMTMGQ